MINESANHWQYAGTQESASELWFNKMKDWMKDITADSYEC